MNSEHLDPAKTPEQQETKALPARFVDEKISDDSGTEATADRALAPAELKNPFWN